VPKEKNLCEQCEHFKEPGYDNQCEKGYLEYPERLGCFALSTRKKEVQDA
jgi:hypothetical protein